VLFVSLMATLNPSPVGGVEPPPDNGGKNFPGIFLGQKLGTGGYQLVPLVPGGRGEAEHEIWAAGFDALQLRERLRQSLMALPAMPSLDERWQKLIQEELLRLGLSTPEQQARWLEAIQQDPQQWKRFLENIQHRLEQGKPGNLSQPGHSSDNPPGIRPPHRPVVPPEIIPPDLHRLPSPWPPANRPITTDLNQLQPALAGMTDQQLQQWEAFRELWERYVGPLEATPELRDLLWQTVTNSEIWNIRDASGRTVWEILRQRLEEAHNRPEEGTTTGEGNETSGQADGERSRWSWLRQWRWPRVGSVGRWWQEWRQGDTNPRSSPGRSFFGFEGWPDIGRWGFWLLVIAVLGMIALAAWLHRRPPGEGHNWSFRSYRAGLSSIDPRQVQTRQDLIRAFESLSLQRLGPAARSWTAGSIAQALQAERTVSAEQIQQLAGLYELARYAPPSEDWPAQRTCLARTLLCRLAGVTPP
ncbi:MAG: DUF4129 domain-containing protein, partial [Gemmataceae bacterium]|nr:DUF4129 domain-containing protein [Gemmataceae bacterium]